MVESGITTKIWQDTAWPPFDTENQAQPSSSSLPEPDCSVMPSQEKAFTYLEPSNWILSRPRPTVQISRITSKSETCDVRAPLVDVTFYWLVHPAKVSRR